MQLIELTDNIKNESGIYCISNNIDNRFYIGSTKNFYVRKRFHFIELKGNYHNNQHLQRFYNKYGKDSLQFKVLEICPVNDLISKEQYYIDELKPQFNICKKADRPNGNNRIFTEEDIKNIANLYNGGKNFNQISLIYFGKSGRSSCISKIVRGEKYSEYNHFFNEYRKTTIGKFSDEDVLKIINLYNSGNTTNQIMQNFDGKATRGNINGIIRGETYKQFSHLINKRIKVKKEKINKNGRPNTWGAKLLSIKVGAFDKSGNLIKSYNSMTDAERDGYILCCISSCCKGKRKTHKNLIWKYI